MICDNCYDRETCPKRKLGKGKHISSCVMFFPDLSEAKCKAKIRKPEKKERV